MLDETILAQLTWKSLNPNVNNDLKSIYFIDSLNGFAAGDTTIVLKTIDGGASWNVSYSDSPFSNRENLSVHSKDKESVFVASFNKSGGPYGHISDSRDSAVTWNHTSFSADGFCSIYFLDNDTGYASGYNKLVKTINNGQSWNLLTPQVMLLAPFLNSIYFPSAKVGYSVGYSMSQQIPLIFKTNNYGNTWDTLSNPSHNYFRSTNFLNENIGYVVGDAGIILRTNDGGNNWIIQNVGVNNKLNSVVILDSSNAFIVGENGLILETKDAGLNWVQRSSGTTQNLYSIYFINSNLGYIAGDNGTILTSNNLIQNLPKPLPNNKSLNTVYPNPTNGIININSLNSINHISIYNMAGKLVYNTKSTDNQFDLGFLPSGRYILELNNELTQTISIQKFRK